MVYVYNRELVMPERTVTCGPDNPKISVISTTQLEKFKARFVWDIQDFDVLFPPTSNGNSVSSPRYAEVTSPSFIIAEQTDFESEWAALATMSFVSTRWCLGLYIMLVKEKMKTKKVCECFIDIVNKNMESLERGHMNQVFEPQHTFSWGWASYKDLDMIYRERNTFLGSDNTLHVVIEMTLHGKIRNITKSRLESIKVELENQKEATSSKYRDNLSLLFNSGMKADAEIVCGSVLFPVHANILSAQSEVFQKIFDSEMKEGITHRVEVSGVDPESMALFLSTLYTGDISELLTRLEGDLGMTSSLIELADMYLLSDLKETCFLHLLERMCYETAGEVAVLSYFHVPSAKVQTEIKRFVQENWAILIKTSSFLKYLSEKPEAFEEYLSEPVVPNLIVPQNFELRRSEPSPEVKLPLIVKMAVGAYFAGLAATLGVRAVTGGTN